MRRLILALLLAISGCAVANPAPAAYRTSAMVIRNRAIAEVTPTASKSNATAYSAARWVIRSNGYSSAFCTALDPSQKNGRGAATAGRALLRHSMKPAKPADRRANFLTITALQNMVRRNISYPGRRINRAMAQAGGAASCPAYPATYKWNPITPNHTVRPITKTKAAVRYSDAFG